MCATTRLIGLAVCSCLFLACTSGPTGAQPAKTLAKTLARTPAQEENNPVPLVTSLETVVYSWTNSPLAVSDAAAYVGKQIEAAQACIPRIAANPTDPIGGCEGNGMAAGPGLYVSDNPFTSHDYGRTVVILKSISGKTNIGNNTRAFGQADDIDRALTGDVTTDGILYNFRANDLNTRALVVRGSGLIDGKQVRSINTRRTSWKKFGEHAPFACDATTSIGDLLSNWGDQLEFMSYTFSAFNDDGGGGFADGAGLNKNGFVVATIGDAVALDDDAVKLKIAELLKKYPALKESLAQSACEETEAMSQRKCLFLRLFSSVRGDEGTPKTPSYSWKFNVTIRVLNDLGVLTSREAKGLSDSKKLTAYLARRFPLKPQRAARANEAFHCMKAVRDQVKLSHFGLWAVD